MILCALTTVDNPYDYFEQTDEWEAYENFTGGRVYKMMGEFAYTSESLSYAENAKAIERAVDDIVKYDMIGIFKKVTKEVPDPE